MSSYVLMKLLESAPDRYDRGMRILFGSLLERVYREIADRVASPEARILDIGCGTGGVTFACAARGARVVGIDVNPAMLEVARSKHVDEHSEARVEWLELGAMEIEDRFPGQSFDAVVSCLTFSELYPEEQSYVFNTVHSRLNKSGTLVIADEVWPSSWGDRLWRRLRRAPAAALTYLLTQTTTRPVDHLEDRIYDAGFERVIKERLPPGDFVLVQAWKE
jgi:SAM-dependent methyltransferase